MVFARLLIPACLTLGISASHAGEHYNFAFVDLELKNDSVFMSVQADRLDLMNSVNVFPYTDEMGDSRYRLYEDKIEAYLQQKMALSADGRQLYMPVVRWFPGGSSRRDGFDSTTVQTDYHIITLGAKLPEKTKTLTFHSEIWAEKEELDPSPAKIELGLFQNGIALKRVWTFVGKTVRFPILPDSLANMRRNPPPPGIRRIPVDHSQHND